MSEATMYMDILTSEHFFIDWLTILKIKYLRVPDEIIDLVKDQQQNQPSNRGRGGGGAHRGDAGRGDRGRGGSRGGSGRGRGRGRGGA